jgi:hypothetical protein
MATLATVPDVFEMARATGLTLEQVGEAGRAGAGDSMLEVLSTSVVNTVKDSDLRFTMHCLLRD